MNRFQQCPAPKLTYSQHYDETFHAEGERCELTLIHADIYGAFVNFVYQWKAEISYEEADNLDTRARAYIACAIYDAAIAAGLSCQPDLPHGQRPSWIIEGERMITLVNAGFDFSNKTCFMQVGPAIIRTMSAMEERPYCKGLIAGFKSQFSHISIDSICHANVNYDIFISYKVENVLLVRQITEQLIASGLKPWFDEYQIVKTSQNWKTIIQESIKRSKYGLVFVDSLYLQSNITIEEYNALLSYCGSDKVIQIILEEEVLSNSIIKKPKWSFQFTGSKTINDLLSYIEKILGKSIQKINIKIDDDVKKYYIAKCMNFPYRLNITSWNKEPPSLFSFLFRIFTRIFNRGVSHIGPELYRIIEKKQIRMNLLVGPENSFLFSISSRIQMVASDRDLQNELRRFAITYFNRYNMKLTGVHLVKHHEFMQFAFTYQLLQGVWCRKYAVILPKPYSKQVVEFTFTFGFHGSFQEFCSIAWLCDQLVISLEWPIGKSDDAIALTNRAFHLVEQGKYDLAIILLEKAISINPKIGDAYNELAFIYGKIKGNFDQAEKYIQQALECDPYNPKFLNSANCIQLHRIKQLRSRKEILGFTKKHLQNINEKIAKYPNYPGFYLSKAIVLALSGEPMAVWKNQLEIAKKVYQKRDKFCSGSYIIEPNQIDKIIGRIEKECIEMNNFWNNLS